MAQYFRRSKFSNNYIMVDNMLDDRVSQNDISNNSTRRLNSNLLSNGEREESFLIVYGPKAE